MMYAGIDIGGTSVKYALVDEQGDIFEYTTVETNSENGYDAVIALIKTIIIKLSSNSQSIGIGFPSVVHPITGWVYYPPNLHGWEEVPLKDILQEGCSVPIAIENDANVAAYAESVYGAGMGVSNFLYVTLGTGVGGGVLINHKIYSGERGGAGEIGHIIVDTSEEPSNKMMNNSRVFRAGTLEERVGRNGIIASAKRFAKFYPYSVLSEYGDELDVEHISVAAYKGDKAALDCLSHNGKILGLGLASALAILDMRLIVVGGGISLAHPILLDSVRETLKLRALPTIAKEVEVKQAHFTKYAGVIGAAMIGKLALEK
jgi:glucokinase